MVEQGGAACAGGAGVAGADLGLYSSSPEPKFPYLQMQGLYY